MTEKEYKTDVTKLTRTKLIEEATKFPNIGGASGMKKEELIAAILAEQIKAGGEGDVVPKEKKPVTAAVPEKKVDRAQLKAKLKELKKSRQEAIEARDSVRVRRIRRRYNSLNRQIRRQVGSAKAG